MNRYGSLVILTICSLFIQSQSSYNVYNYDLSSPIFTPDGLIKQVEYANAAKTQSNPMVILPLTHCEGQCAILVATLRTKEHVRNTKVDVSDFHEENDSEKKDEYLTFGQSRIVEMPISFTNLLSSGNSANQHAGTSVLLGLNGVLSDNVSLLKVARDYLQSWYATYGIHRLHHDSTSLNVHASSFIPSAIESAMRIAHSIGNKCQENSFGGGMRPFGSTIVTCGVDKHESCVCITTPSGAVSCNRYCSIDSPTGEGRDDFREDKDATFDHSSRSETMKRSKFMVGDLIIIGGKENHEKNKLQERITDMNGRDNDESSIKSCMKIVIDSLLKYTQEKESYQGQSALEKPQKDDMLQQLDVVLLTSDGGFQRIHPNFLSAL